MTVAERYRRLSTVFDGTVVGVTDWDVPSPCKSWSARDVLEHVASSQAEIVTRVGLTIARSIDSADEPTGSWREVTAGMQAILDDPANTALEYESMGASTTLADTIDRFICFDLIVHRWDIARASGQAIEIAAGDIDDGNAFLDSMGQMFYDYGASGPAVPVPDDAPAQDRLIGRAGRDPHWPTR